MHETEALAILEGHRQPTDAVYSLVRRERRPFYKDLLDVIFTQGLFSEGKDLVANTSAPFYLIANENGGTIVRLRDGEVVDMLRVGTWQPSDKERFKSVNINGHNYRKVARIA